MKSIQVDYEPESKAVTMKKKADTTDWIRVCQIFNDDIERVMDIENYQNGLTGMNL